MDKLLQKISMMAASHGWKFSHRTDYMLSFTKEPLYFADVEPDLKKLMTSRINIHWKKRDVVSVLARERMILDYRYDDINFIVQTTLLHPNRKKREQLNRAGVSLKLLEKLFKNPRQHTGKGYYQNS